MKKMSLTLEELEVLYDHEKMKGRFSDVDDFEGMMKYAKELEKMGAEIIW